MKPSLNSLSKLTKEGLLTLPDDYKVADMVKIRKVVIAGVSIPGVKAWQEESLRVSAPKE